MKSGILCAVMELVAMFFLASQPDSSVPAKNLCHTTSFVVFPADCNANSPMLFGGKMLAEMDRTAGIATRRLLYHSPLAKDAVTVSQKCDFKKAAAVKDLLFITATVTDLGEKSVKMMVTVDREIIAEGQFVFVAFELETKKAIPHGLVMPVHR
jgi:acyl-CoA hydrolase